MFDALALAEMYDTALVISLLLFDRFSCGPTVAKEDTIDCCFGTAPLALPTAVEVLGC